MPKLGGLGVFDLLGLVDPPQESGYLVPATGEDNVTKASAPFGKTTIDELVFQYWPASLQDSKEIGWEAQRIPGMSHPLMSWSSGGERKITFAAQFTRDVDAGFGILDLVQGNVPEAQIYQKARNPDLRAVAKWLRWYTYPLYSGDGIPTPPPRLLLVLPGMQLGWDGSDEVQCVMTECDIEYSDWFSSGVPKKMTVSMSFSECIQQSDGSVLVQSRDIDLADSDARGPGDYTQSPPKLFKL